jgi:hypothetical protein
MMVKCVQVLLSIFFVPLQHHMGGDVQYAKLLLLGMFGADIIMIPAALIGARPHAQERKLKCRHACFLSRHLHTRERIRAW